MFLEVSFSPDTTWKTKETKFLYCPEPYELFLIDIKFWYSEK